MQELSHLEREGGHDFSVIHDHADASQVSAPVCRTSPADGVTEVPFVNLAGPRCASNRVWRVRLGSAAIDGVSNPLTDLFLLADEDTRLVVDQRTTGPVTVQDMLPVPVLQRPGSANSTRIVNEDRSLSRQHIVRVDSADCEVVGALQLREVAHGDDRHGLALVRAEPHAGDDVAGVHPAGLARYPERVGVGDDDRRGSVTGLHCEVSEVLVIVGDDRRNDRAGLALPGFGIGSENLIADLDVLDVTVAAVCELDLR